MFNLHTVYTSDVQKNCMKVLHILDGKSVTKIISHWEGCRCKRDNAINGGYILVLGRPEGPVLAGFFKAVCTLSAPREVTVLRGPCMTEGIEVGIVDCIPRSGTKCIKYATW